MWRRPAARRWHFHIVPQGQQRTLSGASKPFIKIDNATFYRRYPSKDEPSSSNPPLFPGFSFRLEDRGGETIAKPSLWAVVSPSSIARTTFLQILADQHFCIPPTARTYPMLSELRTSPQRAIKYVGFDADRGSKVGGNNVRGAYLSARYESRREETDFSVHDYLTGHTELNALEDTEQVDSAALDDIVEQLNLERLLQMPVANLSNGQTRRARIAKALMVKPEILLLDGPFMGLDPKSLAGISNVLQRLAERNKPRIVMSLRPEDGVPSWVGQLCVVDEQFKVLAVDDKDSLFSRSTKDSQQPLDVIVERAKVAHDMIPTQKLSRDGFAKMSPAKAPGEAVVEMQGVQVSYGSKTVLGDWTQEDDEGQPRQGLWWSLHRGQRCGIFGANGSGKTTLLSLVTSDHPQTYSLPIKHFGRSRLPSPGVPGISLFDIQKRMGHSSPEVHAFFPRGLTVRAAIESAWADTPKVRARLDKDSVRKVDACLRWFARELNPRSDEPTLLEKLGTTTDVSALNHMYSDITANDADIPWATDTQFGELSFSSQRLVLFLRALIAKPDLIILDEALSGIDETTRDKALLFLSQGETATGVVGGGGDELIESPIQRLGKVAVEGLSDRQALLVISHAREDVPGCVRDWICLPEPGEGKIPPRTGTLTGPLELNPRGWDEIWGRHVR